MKTFKEFISESVNNEVDPKSFDSHKTASKLLKSRGATLRKGQWTRGNGKTFESDGMKLTFYSVTDYKKIGMLRDPNKTKYSVYATLSYRGNYFTIDFGSSTGESTKSDEKIAALKDKVIKWADNVFGIKLGTFDFSY